MFTIEYKGFYIHGYCDKKECRVQGNTETVFWYNKEFNSVLAAKQGITKAMKR